MNALDIPALSELAQRVEAHFDVHFLNVTTLQELVGPWSSLALLAGFGGAAMSYLSSKWRPVGQPDAAGPKMDGVLAVGMIVLAAVIFLFVLPTSMAYSGPIPSNMRHLRDYDKYFATLIALVFAAMFTFESCRPRTVDHRR